jgi:PAS domain S-box-containing protein
VERTAQKSLPLILAREFASNVATPLSILDEQGTLVFFNEPAERIIGRTHAELGDLSAEEWRTRFRAERPDGTRVADDELPTSIALSQHRPAHETLVYTMLDGRRRTLSVTAIPLLERGEELAGVVVVFWEADRA